MVNLPNYNLTRECRDYININPIQRGGILTEEAKRVLLEFGDGYSICDYCEGNLLEIKKPPVERFRKDLASFIGADEVIFTAGARESIFLVFATVLKRGDTIIIDQNRHYTTDLAAEFCEIKTVIVKNSGYPHFEIRVEDYIPLIKQYNPKAIFLTYPDGEYGNLADVKKLGQIAKEYEVIFIVNSAYSMGRMPVNMKEFSADFIIGSGHKSMACSGPVGILGMREKYRDKILAPSKSVRNKFYPILGCTVRGAPLLTLMASFPYVIQRVNEWKEEIKKAQYFCEEFEKIGKGGIHLLGQRPHLHDLMKFETPLFYEISQTHKWKRQFLYKILKEHRICGVKPGLTKFIKLSTYRLSYEEINHLLSVFAKIIKECAK